MATKREDLMSEIAHRTGLVPGEHAPPATAETAETHPYPPDTALPEPGDLLTSPPPTMTVSMARKINLGQYESADAFISISGVTAGMTEEEMQPLLETGKLAWAILRDALVEKTHEMRNAGRQ